MEFTSQQEKKIGLYFRLGVFFKGLFSLVEIIGGLLALFVPVSYVTDIVVRLAEGELVEDPNDFVATNLLHLAQHYAMASGTFIAIYLLSRGLIKIFLVVALLKNQLWAYPSSLVVLGLFVLYQLYQIATTHSVLLILFTVFDAIVMWFIWKEYEVVCLTKKV